MASHQPETLKK